MKRYYATCCLLVAVLGVALLITVPAQGKTEQTRQITIDEFLAPVGLAYRQSLCVSVVNPLPPAAPGEDGRRFKMLFAFTVFDAGGRVIVQTDEITLAPGEFHSFNLNRNDVPLPGELGTGRLQIRGEIRRQSLGNCQGAVCVAVADVHGVVELVDNLTGQTQAAALLPNFTLGTVPGRTFLGQVKEGDITSSSEQFQVRPVLLGLAREQSLRVSVANVNGTLLIAKQQALRARIDLHDSSGNLIAQSPELVIPPGELRFYDFPRSALPLTGEDPTGRVQMAANVFLKLDNTIGTSDSVPVTLELVANVTGQTITILPVPAVQKVREH